MTKSFFLTVLFISPACWLVFSQSDNLAQTIARGKDVYIGNCMSCHMEKGEGIEALYPPLAKADYMLKDQKRSIRIILQGQTGEITVNGKKYNVDMPAQNNLTDEQIADVLNYIYNSWGNKGKVITPDNVKAERKPKQ